MERPRAGIVTGAASGIGLETAKLLLVKGFKVVMVDRELHRIQASIDGLQASDCAGQGGYAMPVAQDLATAQGCAECMTEALDLLEGHLDVLVNCAGVFRLSTLGDTSPEMWQWLLDTNFHSVIRLSTAARPHLEKTRGCIVNVSSISAKRAAPGLGAYCTTKAAQDMFTECAALEWAPQGIRVNSVNPSTIKSNLHRSAGLEQQDLERFFAEDVASHPLGRIGTPADVAAVCVFLADSDQSGWVTGQHIVVDGGRLLPAPTARMQ